MSLGYSAVSIADVATKSGLARTAIYNYFPDREALLFAWTEREVNRAITLLEERIVSADSRAAKLRVFIQAQLEGFGTRHFAPGQEVMQFLRPETYQNFMSHIEPLERILVDIVEDGLRAREFSGVDAEDAVHMIMACVGSERAPLASQEISIDDATERVATFVLRALGASPVKPAPKTSSDPGHKPKKARPAR